ncbi:MAG: hypothetical protein LAT82_02440 [Nanoarchaeota archaeon]|nr:hypothetical protein [Nanoarchaeota archaeon]
MNIEQIFTGVGIVFLIITIGYFVGTYLDIIPTSIKVALSFIASAILFIVADIMRRSNR